MIYLRRIEIEELPTPQQPQIEKRYLYIIGEDEEHFKIGIASHPLRRLSALQSGNRRKLTIRAAYGGGSAACAYIEKRALKFFKAKIGSEWIRVRDLTEITEFIGAFCEDDAI